MVRTVAIVLTAALLVCWAGGCPSETVRSDVAMPAQGFYPAAVAFQPSFTRIRSSISGQPSGSLDAYVVVNDQFGEPLKALGVFRFELFHRRPGEADPRGPRFTDRGLQEFDLTAVADNQAHWHSISHSYHFSLDLPEGALAAGGLVLEVTFRPAESEVRLGDVISVDNR